MGKTIDYNLATTQVTVDDFRVTGWAEDDALSLAPLADMIEHAPAADGTHVVVNAVNDPRWEGTMKVRRGSAAYKALGDALVAQAAEMAVGSVSELPFRVYDPVSGDKFFEPNMRFVRMPDLPFAKGASVAEFKLLAPSPTIEMGKLVSTSA